MLGCHTISIWHHFERKFLKQLHISGKPGRLHLLLMGGSLLITPYPFSLLILMMPSSIPLAWRKFSLSMNAAWIFFTKVIFKTAICIVQKGFAASVPKYLHLGLWTHQCISNIHTGNRFKNSTNTQYYIVLLLSTPFKLDEALRLQMSLTRDSLMMQ